MAVYGNLSVGAGTRKVLGEGVQCIWVFFHLSVYVQLRRERWDFLQHSLSFSQALIYCTFSGSLLNLCSCSDSSWPVYACLKVGEGKLCPQCAAGQTGTDSDGLRAGERPYTYLTSGPEAVCLPNSYLRLLKILRASLPTPQSLWFVIPSLNWVLLFLKHAKPWKSL